MRRVACTVFALSVLAAATTADGLAADKPVQGRAAMHVRAVWANSLFGALQRVARAEAVRAGRASRPAGASGTTSLLSALEADIVARMNAVRGARGLRPLRVSRGLTAAATYHTRQMGAFGFFEHESRNGAPFWKRIERFYPSSRYSSWSVGENLLWESPAVSATGAVREWMTSPPHRENILSGEWREVGLAAVHFNSAPGEYRGRPVTIVTADFGARR